MHTGDFRPDRDDYIQIFHENIKDDRIKNFDVKSHAEIDSLGVPYDFDSVMHYRKVGFLLLLNQLAIASFFRRFGTTHIQM